jgi:microcystin-dependent protein
MHKIDGPGHLNNQFAAEDVATGRAPTVVTPEWLNAIQGELVAVITDAGLALNKANNGQLLAALNAKFNVSPTEPGAVGLFARNSPPSGWIKANGALLSRTTYAALFAAIGTTFGNGDGSTTFALPDLRGEFARGWDDARGVDVGRAFGSAQAAQFESHTHQFDVKTGYYNDVAGTNAPTGTYPGRNTTGQWATSSSGGTETRPRNIALLACIKF